jgi:hypothetical protein
MLLLLQPIARANPGTPLVWEASSDPNIAGYNVYYGTTSHEYTSMITTGNVTSVTIPGLTPGTTYYFAVTTYDNMGDQSDFSNEVSFSVPTVTAPPLITSTFVSSSGQFGLSVTGVAGNQYVVQSSTNLINWVVLQTNTAPFNFIDINTAGFSRRFFRVSPVSAVVTTPPTSTFVSGGQFGLTITGVSGNQYVVEASTDLINWIAVQTNTAPFTFTDPNTANFSQRFFRVVNLSL